MPSLPLSDVTLHYEIDGTGPPVLLIAGTASDSASWVPLLAPLAAHFTVIRPDNRSTGRTVPVDAPLSVDHWAADAAALVGHLGLGPVAVVGHSLGGTIGVQMAAEHPAQVSRLALLASAPVNAPRNLALFDLMLRLRAEGQPPDLWLRAFLPWLFHPRFFELPGQMDAAIAQSLAYPHAQSARAMAAQVAAIRDFDGDWALDQVLCPVLSILGDSDLLIPEPAARAALAPLGNLTIRTLAGAGHSVHWDAPEATLAALLPFLTEETP
ncbi:alpha/beta fold hydrolase [Roseisalinus antarcticus]|uniref:Haloacetate dehalogenase H-1 n=1 Tax=Roseisalinus antarcticus TaxID=254357 RepID=A0A1Y5SGP4_9RHOB|nr:alpha/beta fold hydrolase [Roseisalinus antarcticus]SLN37537.1 Haloacetate dehalogenase H-1 [Roseisalinus antarcticus]